MDKLVVLPELLKDSACSEQTEKAERIFYQYYKKEVSQPQKKISDIMDTILNSEYSQRFLESMKQLKVEKLYKSNVHGQDHVERVCILTAYLGIRRKIGEQMFALCLEAAKYHDIGRCDDSEDRLHGSRGSLDVQECCDKFCEKECALIAAVVEAHSLLDVEAEQVFKKYNLLSADDFDMFQTILYIVKDADALDRFRLTDYSLKTGYLRLPESKTVIQAACGMNQLLMRWRIAVVSWTDESVRVIRWMRRFMPHIEIAYILEKDIDAWHKKIEGDIEVISIERGCELYKCNLIHKIIIPCIRKGIVLSSMYFLLKEKGVSDKDLLYAPYRLVYCGEEYEKATNERQKFYHNDSISWEQSTESMCNLMSTWSN